MLDLAGEAGPDRVHVTLPECCDLCLGHPGPDPLGDVPHRERGDLVRKQHAFDLLCGLDRAALGEKGPGVECVWKRLEPALREDRRLADHEVSGLRCL
jgi:hypothetical protein